MPGKTDVEHHHIRVVLVEQPQALLAIVCRQHRRILPLELEADGQGVEQPLLVVHHQDLHRADVPRSPVGSAIRNVAPLPGRLSTQMRPPCSSTIAFAMGRPETAPLGPSV